MMDKVKISGIEYAIVMKTSEEMGGNIGLANFNTQEISINQNMISIHYINSTPLDLSKIQEIISLDVKLALSETAIQKIKK